MLTHQTEEPTPPLIWDGCDVVYEIYLPTFCEAVEDGQAWRGEGNLRGVMSKLDYLCGLGVTAIWLTPFYPSGGVDGGYDVTDFMDVDPQVGTLADFDRLTHEAHSRGIKILVDLIPNHTSDQHPWFQESRSSRDNPKADWYIWHDPKPDGSVPSNWATVFSLPQLQARKRGELQLDPSAPTPPLTAWEFDETRGQYYLHSFTTQQPDLNWANPDVRHAFKDVMHFWIGRGVDGFRIDAVNYIGKDLAFTDELPDPSYREGVDTPYDQLQRYYSTGFPGTFYDYLQEIDGILDEYPAKNLRIIFEAYMPLDALHRINSVKPGQASAFNFTRLRTRLKQGIPWDAQLHGAILRDYYANLPAGSVPNQMNGNHDRPRLASRYGERPARAAALINLMLPGEVYVYNGEEGGFVDVAVPPERQRDRSDDRDGERTPMLWTPGKNAGFSQADSDRLWLPIDPEYRTRNLETQSHDPASSLSLYTRLIALRQGSEVLRRGEFVLLTTTNPDVLSFARRLEHEQVLVVVNFSDQTAEVQIPDTGLAGGRVAISSLRPSAGEIATLDTITLAPDEALVIVPSN